MSDQEAVVGIKKVWLEIKVTHADGTTEDHGVVASSDPEEAERVGGTVTLEEMEPPYIAIPKQLYRRVKRSLNKEQ